MKYAMEQYLISIRNCHTCYSSLHVGHTHTIFQAGQTHCSIPLYLWRTPMWNLVCTCVHLFYMVGGMCMCVVLSRRYYVCIYTLPGWCACVAIHTHTHTIHIGHTHTHLPSSRLDSYTSVLPLCRTHICTTLQTGHTCTYHSPGRAHTHVHTTTWS